MNGPRKPLMDDNLMRSFGRVHGRKLRPEQQRVVDELLPKVCVDIDNLDELSAEKELWLEIGFGDGAHVAGVAKKNPDISIIGCEPFLNGVARLLKSIEEDGLNNIKVLNGDGRILMDKMPEGIVSKVFILFPDPWPKAKHHKKRIVNNYTLDLVAKVLKSGGILEVATDHDDYSVSIAEILEMRSDFKDSGHERSKPFDGWVETKYQKKAKREGRDSVFFQFVKK